MNDKYDISWAIVKTAKPLADFLEEYLSQTDTNWWHNKVVSSFKEIWKIDNLKYRNLHKLDTAALLSIFFRNLILLKELAGFNYYKMKNYVTECQTIRVQYMHIASDFEAADDDVARDFDTLYRLCKSIKADRDFLEYLESGRNYFALKAITSRDSRTVDSDNNDQVTPMEEMENPEEVGTSVYTVNPTMQMIHSTSSMIVTGAAPLMMNDAMYNSFGVRY